MLTVCVIGRNEARNIARMAAGLVALNGLPFPVEIIFVDSASTDESAELARGCFDKVYVLEDSDHLSAAAGRYVGTLRARGDWILYLDGDMALCEDFVPVVERVCSVPAERTGWIGRYRNVYNTGGIRENLLGYQTDGVPVAHFGGAVLLPRKAVVDAGNWEPGVYSNEEIDLYTRLRGIGCTLRFADAPMIEHFVERQPKWRILLENFFPGKILGKKFYGFGQVLEARVKSRQLVNFIRYFPYPFVYWVTILIAIFFVTIGLPIPAFVIFIVGIAYILRVKGFNFIALYLALLVQGVLGYRRFDPDYTPGVETVLENPASASQSRLIQ